MRGGKKRSSEDFKITGRKEPSQGPFVRPEPETRTEQEGGIKVKKGGKLRQGWGSGAKGPEGEGGDGSSGKGKSPKGDRAWKSPGTSALCAEGAKLVCSEGGLKQPHGAAKNLLGRAVAEE